MRWEDVEMPNDDQQRAAEQRRAVEFHRGLQNALPRYQPPPLTIDERLRAIQADLQALRTRLDAWRVNTWLALGLVGWALLLLTFGKG